MVTLRNYRRADYSAVKALLKEADLFDKVWDCEANLAGMVKRNPDSIIIAEDHGMVVGNLYIIPHGPQVAYLFRLVVKKTFRKQGIGTQLLERAEEIVKKRGVKEIGFFVYANNQELQHFYTKRKYRVTKEPFIYLWKDLK